MSRHRCRPSAARCGRRTPGLTPRTWGNRGGSALQLHDVVGAIRRHLVILVAAVLVGVGAAGLWYAFGREPDGPRRYSSTVLFAVPSRDPEAPTTAGEDVPRVVMRSQTALVTSNDARRRALEAADLNVNNPIFEVEAGLADASSTLAVTVFGGSQDSTDAFADAMVNTVLDTRRQVVAQDIVRQRGQNVVAVAELRQRLAEVEAELEALIGELPAAAPVDDESVVEDDQTTRSLLELPDEIAFLQLERDVLFNRIANAQLRTARLSVDSIAPAPYAEFMGRSLTDLVSGGEASPFVPVAVFLLAGLAIGVTGAVVVDRFDRTIRSSREAERAFEAPILSTLAPRRQRHGEHAVLEGTDVVRQEAYRTLAATSIATDRLPKAIMVTAPEGDDYEEVAANFAAALAELGLRVALIATTPRQWWFLEPCEPGHQGTASFPELLEEAHTGALNGQVTDRLASTTRNRNLFVVPPAADQPDRLPLDGLPPFLGALDTAGVDIAVIAGPEFLTDANATIMAWVTRNVLWVCRAGETSGDRAERATSRLQLAGAEPFGVVMISAED